jgi:hypothetical protein
MFTFPTVRRSVRLVILTNDGVRSILSNPTFTAETTRRWRRIVRHGHISNWEVIEYIGYFCVGIEDIVTWLLTESAIVGKVGGDEYI